MTVASLGAQLTYAAMDRIRLEQLLHLQRELRIARRANQSLAEENVDLIARLAAYGEFRDEGERAITREMIRARLDEIDREAKGEAA